MKTNTILKWLVIPSSTFVLIGCGGGGGSSSSAIATGQAFYVDSAVQGANYNCGTQSGVTGSKGEFTFEVGKSCTFSLDKIKLRDVAADELANGKVIQETNIKIAKVLLSLDSDHNPENGITIDVNRVKKMVESGWTTFTDILNDWSELFSGTIIISDMEAKAHLIKSILKAHTLYTNINTQSGTLESWSFSADFNSVVVTEIEGGSDTDTVSVHFDGNSTFTFGTHLIDQKRLVIKEIKEDYCIVLLDGDETRLYYDEAKARAYFLN